ncbi:MAG TPA: F0F1 ATP synthase subunit B [Fimbriimonadaceae bacterium]|jgi:F-type H+-transporting ATPase subunit b
MRWIIAIVITAVLWGLSATPFIDQANQVLILQQLGLNLKTALVQMGAVVLMFPFVDQFFLAPLREAMYERTQKIEETYTEIETLRDQMAQVKVDYEKRLEQTEAEAREQIQSQIKEAQELRTQLMHEAAAKAEELVRRAQDEIENEKKKVIGELRLEVVNLTLSATEKILGENMNSERNRKLVEDFINTVEAPA